MQHHSFIILHLSHIKAFSTAIARDALSKEPCFIKEKKCSTIAPQDCTALSVVMRENSSLAQNHYRAIQSEVPTVTAPTTNTIQLTNMLQYI